MKRKLVLFSGLMLVLFCGQVLGQIDLFEQQKKEIIDTIYSNPQFAPLIDVQQAKKQLSELSTAVEQVRSEYDKLDVNQQNLEDAFSEVQISIEYIIADMQRMEQALDDDLLKLSLGEKKVNNLKTELDNLKTEYVDSKQNLETYAKFLYHIYNSYYSMSNVSSLKLLVRSDSIAYSMSSRDLVEILVKKLKLMIASINNKQVAYVNYTLDLNKERLEYEHGVSRYEVGIQNLDEQKQHLYQLMSFIQGDLSKSNQKISDLNASKAELENQIDVLENMTDPKTQQILDDNSGVFELLNEIDRDDGNKYFSRPIFPVEDIEYYFHDNDYYESESELNNRMRLNVPQNSVVRSPAPAIVYKIFDSPDVGLSWVVLLHKYGYVTIMSPLSKIFVAPNDVIARGDAIGRSGGQPGTIGAGMYSKSSHLDMEVLKNGDHIDPFELLDISIFKDQTIIPKDWNTKYLQDYYSREVELSELLPLEGDTISERRDSFLQQYAVGPYVDPAIWYKGAEGTNIDPLFGICIGFAETNFKHFKSMNNVGNVGNDDSGNTVIYDNPLDGVTAVYETLNNQYLGEYSNLLQLSRYGNQEGYIYASSPYNRQKNIMKCLSSIYDLYIPEDFIYRAE